LLDEVANCSSNGKGAHQEIKIDKDRGDGRQLWFPRTHDCDDAKVKGAKKHQGALKYEKVSPDEVG
jgi:hypothetical protein